MQLHFQPKLSSLYDSRNSEARSFTHLGDEDPDNTEPPEVERGKHCSKNITKSTGEQVTNYILDGVT